MVRIKNLVKIYGSFTAVDDVSFSLDKGKFLTVLGPSGSGKTTTLMSVAGFLIPDGGKIYVADQDITKLAPYKRNIGMVFQNYARRSPRRFLIFSAVQPSSHPLILISAQPTH